MRCENLHAVGALLLAALAGPAGSAAWAQDGAAQPFPKEALDNPEYIETGKGVFEQICKFCHGKTAYPGKAPALNPSRYTPEFVFDRVTNGFRAMPPFKDTYSEKERQGVAAYVMSKEFSN